MIVIWDNGDWLMRGWSCVPHLCNILIGHSDIIDGWYLKVKVKGILKTETLCPKCKSPCVKEVRRKNFRFFKCFKCNIEESIRKRSFLYNKWKYICLYIHLFVKLYNTGHQTGHLSHCAVSIAELILVCGFPSTAGNNKQSPHVVFFTQITKLHCNPPQHVFF